MPEPVALQGMNPLRQRRSGPSAGQASNSFGPAGTTPSCVGPRQQGQSIETGGLAGPGVASGSAAASPAVTQQLKNANPTANVDFMLTVAMTGLF
jgi:hypothetical protein